jgi:hypothetical protein
MLTNNIIGEDTPIRNLTSILISTSWYGQLSAERKAEYLDKQRKSPQKKKKAAALNVDNLEQPKQIVHQGTWIFLNRRQAFLNFSPY